MPKTTNVYVQDLLWLRKLQNLELVRWSCEIVCEDQRLLSVLTVTMFLLTKL